MSQEVSRQVALTGAGGFLGLHTRALLHSLGRPVSKFNVGNTFDLKSSVRAVDGSERLMHLAGVNRGTDREINDSNIEFARQLAAVLDRCDRPPRYVVYANTTQAVNGTIYGNAKAEAGAILQEAAARTGCEFIDIALPNLFGEHGRPFYNSVTATFCHLIAGGGQPQVLEDRELTLLHAQNAAEILAGNRPHEALRASAVVRSVSNLREELLALSAVYRDGTIPTLASDFDRDLFNTYRSFLPPEEHVIPLNRRADVRGSFFEVVRTKNSTGQTSFSTTVPGVTRGQHYHRRKIERFTVLSGKAEISMRLLFSDKLFTYKVDGEEPVAIDMPTLWPHKIINIGSDDLYTSFWANEIFDPSAPDTYSEDV